MTESARPDEGTTSQVSAARWTPAVGLFERLLMLAALTLPMWLLATDLFGYIACAVWQTLLTAMCVGGIIRDTKDGAQWRPSN